MLNGRPAGSAIYPSPQSHKALENYRQLLLMGIAFQLVIEFVLILACLFDVVKSYSLNQIREKSETTSHPTIPLQVHKRFCEEIVPSEEFRCEYAVRRLFDWLVFTDERFRSIPCRLILFSVFGILLRL